MSSNAYPTYSPFAPPPRPLSAGPRAASSPNAPSARDRDQLQPVASCSTTPMTSPALVRPSALNTRPQSFLGGRMRARSIGNGKGGPPQPLAHLSPTLPGSPAFVGGDSFAARGEKGGVYSPLGRAREEDERRRRYLNASDESAEGEAETEGDDAPFSSAEGTEESGSTRSDSPPPRTPRDDGDGGYPTFEVIPPSRRGSAAQWDLVEERENWRTGGELDEDHHPQAKELNTRNRSKSLEGQTRMSLRRGRSFTSLLSGPQGPAVSPMAEKKEAAAAPVPPIFETYELPPTPSAPVHTLSDIESGEEYSPSTASYPPAAGVLPAPTTAALAPRKLRDFVPQLTILLALFASSFAVVLVTISTLPGLFLPHSVSDLPSLTAAMTTYRASSFVAEVHLFAVLTLLFLWKQCFSIPGSVLTNILFGALYGTAMGTWWACLWTATGSTGAYLIAVIIAPLVEYYFATPLAATRRALKLPSPAAAGAPQQTAVAGVAPLSSSDLFSHLMLARLFPLLPYSVLNVISGVLRLPLSPFFITLLLGSLPFNFATVSIGELVALAASDPSVPLGDKIWSRAVVLKLVAVTLVSVVPVLFKDQLKRGVERALAPGGIIDQLQSWLARRAFGFGTVPHATTSTHAAPAPSASANLGMGGPRTWRRKLSRSIGGAGEFLQLAASSAGLGGRRGYERVSSVAAGMEGVAGPSGDRHELSAGVEEAERGGAGYP
ncbi:hypothetical protein JCM10207_002563 [Rhodosporidiobolus poonsookiae]